MYQARYLSALLPGNDEQFDWLCCCLPHSRSYPGYDAFLVSVPLIRMLLLRLYGLIPGLTLQRKKLPMHCRTRSADIIAQHQDTPVLRRLLRSRKIFHWLQQRYEPVGSQAVLTSSVWNLGEYYVNAVKSVQEGTWESGRYWDSMAEGVIGLAPTAMLF